MPKQKAGSLVRQPPARKVETRKVPVKPVKLPPPLVKKKPKKSLRSQNHKPVASYDGPGSDVGDTEGYLDQQDMLGTELYQRLLIVAAKRGLGFIEVLRQAVQRYLESEFIEPTTVAKDAALYPSTDNPVDELPLPLHHAAPVGAVTEVSASNEETPAGR